MRFFISGLSVPDHQHLDISMCKADFPYEEIICKFSLPDFKVFDFSINSRQSHPGNLRWQ